MKQDINYIQEELVEKSILLVRGRKVMLDADLAHLYEVSTKALNQAVKRNQDRFPEEFMFRLNEEERHELVTLCDRFEKLKHSSSLPHVFTEHGALMLASVLNSKRAVDVSIFIVKVFVRLREMLVSHKDLAKKLEQLELKIQGHDESLRSLVHAIRQLMAPDTRKSRKIGFRTQPSEN